MQTPKPKKNLLQRVSVFRGMRVIFGWGMGFSAFALLAWPLGLLPLNASTWLKLVLGGYFIVAIFGGPLLALQRLMLHLLETYAFIRPHWAVRLLLLEFILMGLLAAGFEHSVYGWRLYVLVLLPPVLPALVSAQYRHDV